MYENNNGELKKPISEFEKLLSQLDAALSRQDEIVSSIRKKVNNIIEPVKNPSCDSEKELNKGGFVGEVQARIAVILTLNGELEEIDEILTKVVG